MELPAEGASGAVEHLARFVPPRFATVSEVSERWGVLTVVGPEGPELVSREALGLRVESPELRAMEEGDLLAVEAGGEDRILVTPQAGVAVPALDLLAPAAVTGALARRMAELEVPSLDADEWEVLRVEAGRPAFGVDFDDSVLPVEAGVHDRAIDYEKGCYTGQEVIVRIRDRGRVNRHLRGLVPTGDGEVVPEPREELWPVAADDGAKAVGWITSSVRSPRHGPLALGYVRREIEPGGRVRTDSGVELRVVELAEGWPSG
jgi:folate-binding protein YgfZ